MIVKHSIKPHRNKKICGQIGEVWNAGGTGVIRADLAEKAILEQGLRGGWLAMYISRGRMFQAEGTALRQDWA